MWDFRLTLSDRDAAPLFLQISRAIADDIRRGRLRPGDSLPGSRTLAGQLGVHRNTVVAAYEGLASEGWLITRRAGGTYVAECPLDDAPKPFVPPRSPGAVSEAVGFAMPPLAPARPPEGWRSQEPFLRQLTTPAPPGALSLTGAAPDLRLFPTTPLARAYRQVLQRHAGDVLGLGHCAGHPRLRASVIEMLAARRGIVATPAHVMMTRGALMGLRLVADVLLRPGDTVAVEAPGYPAAWEVLSRHGVRLVPVGIDGHGLQVEHLAAILSHTPVRAVYVTPHHQFPTTAVMSASRRLQLLELAAEHRMAILEDDYDFEFHYEGSPVRPLASADRAGVVIYMGSMSKVMAPGLRLGFTLAAPAVIERMVDQRRLFDVQSDVLLELAIAELGEEGEMRRHVRRARRIYRARRDALAAALQAHLPGRLDFELPHGGQNLWVRVLPGVDVEAWASACAASGVLFHTSRRFDFDGRSGPFARLCYASLDAEQLDEAARRMARAYDGLTGGRQSRTVGACGSSASPSG